MRDEWKCALTELGEQFAMEAEDIIIATTGASMMLLLCAASWDIKTEASLWIAVLSVAIKWHVCILCLNSDYYNQSSVEDILYVHIAQSVATEMTFWQYIYIYIIKSIHFKDLY